MTEAPRDRNVVRRELKYLLPGAGQSAVQRVRSRVPALTRQHEPRRVTSVYFDSADYRCYESSNAGTSQRVKLRLRWYGNVVAAVEPVLELKYRKNHQGWKNQYRIEGLDLSRMTWAEVRSEIDRQISGLDRIRMETLRYQVLMVSYERHYLVTTDRRVRVTVDSSLRFIDQRFRARPNFTFDSIKADFAVVECKFERSMGPAAAARVLQPLGLRWTRFSKYCFGLASLSGV